ncbi:ABC transporter permease [Vallitalea guaymasensis]|uniref:ABC transporter permease n=1 Tax=Vallitalea guaymasensis TaxID=1185412 RepID=UPI002355898F|nr:ABC transporter permease subunit [Vallitalea guaymasensis]
MFKKNKFKSQVEFFSMTLPVIIHIFIFCYIPMVGIIIAFKDFRYDKGIFGSEWIGFENFKFFFSSQDAWRVTRNTALMNIIFIITNLIVCVVVAILMYQLTNRVFVKFYQTTMILPHFLSFVVVGFMTYALLNPVHGVLNQMLVSMGFEPVNVYTSPKYWPFILPLINIWKTVGMGSVIYYAALMGINKEYLEAAAIDGANKWQVTTKIIIPFLVPVMTILTILAIGNIFRADFGMFYQITRNSSLLYETTDVIDTYIFRALRKFGDIGMSSAVGLYQSFVGFILVIVANTIVKKIDKDSAMF